MAKTISKEIRDKVWDKYKGCCAYCGCMIERKKMQVDHIVPIYRNDSDEQLLKMNITRGLHDFDNFNPSCARCNRWKSTFSLEHFREEISKQVQRLFRDSNQFNMAYDFGMISCDTDGVIFHFEKVKKDRYFGTE